MLVIYLKYEQLAVIFCFERACSLTPVLRSVHCQFFNQVLMLGKTSVSDLSEHVFDLILELYNIDSHLLLSVLPQLEFKLKVSPKHSDVDLPSS